MNIDEELAELIHNYNIDECVPWFYPYIKAVSIAKQLYMQLNKVTLVGTKQTDIEWFQKSICDKDVETILLEKASIERKLLEGGKKEIVFLVVSFYGREEAMVQLLEAECHALCVYDVFEQNGLFFQRDFFDVYGEEYLQRELNEPSKDYKNFDINRIFFYHRRRYELEENLQNRVEVLKKLIFDCIYAKDFLGLKKYIHILAELADSENREKYLCFYREIEELLSRIKEALKNRKKKDCLMIWLDALEYGEDESMPFLSSLNGSALEFSNVYTVTPYTGATFKTLFAKSRTVEEESYKITRVGIENSKFLKELRRRNYKFVYYGTRDITEREFSAQHFYVYGNTITQIYWDAVCDILRTEEDTSFFCVLHELSQTHFPFLSMGLLGDQYCSRAGWPGYQPDQMIIDRQAQESRQYVDKQLEFWGRLLPNDMFKIYISDHGHTLLGRYHCILKVQQESIKPNKCQSLISYYNFDKLIVGLFDNSEVDEAELQSNYCVIQDIEYYNKNVILEYLNNRKMPASPTFLPGYQGIITKEDMFIRYNNGVEFYQKKFNDGVMVTDERLNFLRQITGKKQVDIAKEEKFRYSYLAYQVAERCVMRTKDRQKQKVNIIRAIFEEIKEGETLALRGGGIHSLYLMMLLEERLRKKVSYVIDRDQECLAGKLGIKVITMEKAADILLDKVIISSFDYRHAWKEECQQNLRTVVIDLYELFELHGIYCKDEFYHLEYEEQDFEGIAL